MIRGAIVFATVLALAATGASAKDDDDGKAQTEEATKEKKICRTEKMTGSLTRRTRICMTESQWRELNDRTRRGVSEMQGDASGGQKIKDNPGPGGF